MLKPETNDMPQEQTADDPDEQAVAPATQQTSDEERGHVQRKLGRCILRLQQYEVLCKAIVLASDVGGSMSTWEARHQKRKEKIYAMTLGTLVKEMKTSWLARNDVEEEEDASEAPADTNEISIRTRMRHTMDPAEYERTVAAMKQLVDLRNDLVHHFLERFNLWETKACAEANRHLDQSYDLIDRHMNELTGWARHMDEAREHWARALASQDFENFLFGAPAQTPVEQEATVDYMPITRLLRDAELVHASNGWTLLEHAIGFVNGISGGSQFPSRYRCRTWRQLLRRSEAFDIEDHALPDRPGTVAVYRSRGR